jgi:hypothetical protein
MCAGQDAIKDQWATRNQVHSYLFFPFFILEFFFFLTVNAFKDKMPSGEQWPLYLNEAVPFLSLLLLFFCVRCVQGVFVSGMSG